MIAERFFWLGRACLGNACGILVNSNQYFDCRQNCAIRFLRGANADAGVLVNDFWITATFAENVETVCGKTRFPDRKDGLCFPLSMTYIRVQQVKTHCCCALKRDLNWA